MALFNKNNKNQNEIVLTCNIPKHIGFIMDGNGRWAKQRGLARSAGHLEGSYALSKVCEACRKFGVKIVTVYALSTENLQRDKQEVDYIMNLAYDFVKKELNNAVKNDLKINILGNLDNDRVPEKVKAQLLNAVERTKDCKSYVLNIAFVYGGRDEITRAVNKLLKTGVTSVTEQDITNNLDTAGVDDPDLIVRASGEQRISNFLLWQLAYSELYFAEEYWPDFNEDVVKRCITEYQKRNRKFGNV